MKLTEVRKIVTGIPIASTSSRSKPGALTPVQLTVMRCVTCAAFNLPSRQRRMAVADNGEAYLRYIAIRCSSDGKGSRFSVGG